MIPAGGENVSGARRISAEGKTFAAVSPTPGGRRKFATRTSFPIGAAAKAFHFRHFADAGIETIAGVQLTIETPQWRRRGIKVADIVLGGILGPAGVQPLPQTVLQGEAIPAFLMM
ncbi:hypothetical protein SODG_002336 [Sodalis praecaptivus]